MMNLRDTQQLNNRGVMIQDTANGDDDRGSASGLTTFGTPFLMVVAVLVYMEAIISNILWQKGSIEQSVPGEMHDGTSFENCVML